MTCLHRGPRQLTLRTLLTLLVLLAVTTTALPVALGAQPNQKQKAYSERSKRGNARIFYWGGNHSVGQLSIDYGLPPWGERWRKMIAKQGPVRRWRLGKNHWTTLNSNIDLVFLHTTSAGNKKFTQKIPVPAGQYYMTLERDKAGSWILALLDPVKVRARRLDSYHAHYTKGGILLPLRHRDLAEEAGGNDKAAGNTGGKPARLHKTLDIRLKVSGKNDHRALLWIGFGTHELSLPFEMKVQKGQQVSPDIGVEISKDDQWVLERAEKFEIFSLDPDVEVPEKERTADNSLGGYKVIGHKVLAKPAERARVLSLVYKGIVDRTPEVADCFIPRHGVRARVGRQMVELVICYECLFLQVYRNGEQRDHSPGTAKTVRAAMNKLFRAHGLRIAK